MGLGLPNTSQQSCCISLRQAEEDQVSQRRTWRHVIDASEVGRCVSPAVPASETIRYRSLDRRATDDQVARWCRVDRHSRPPARRSPQTTTRLWRCSTPRGRAGWTRVPRSTSGSTWLSSSTSASSSASCRSTSTRLSRTDLPTERRSFSISTICVAAIFCSI